MADEEPKPLAYIPETVLKKRKSNEEWAIKRREQLEDRKQRSKEDRKLIFKRAEQYIKEYRDKELDFIQMKRRKKQQRPFRITPESKVVFVIRIRGTNDMHPKTRKILHLLKLKHMFNGVFLNANERTMDLLQRVEPYVTYGYPNLKSVRELVYKKGYGKVDKQKIPLTDNNIIEQATCYCCIPDSVIDFRILRVYGFDGLCQHRYAYGEALGKQSIICIEDIVHEISTMGPHFKEVTEFLWPMKLNRPEGVVRILKKQFKDGGETGNREDLINDLICKMN